MKKLKIVSFFLVFMCCSVVVFAVKAREISPWMEDIDESGRSSYLIPKGAKRKVVGSQVIIEPPSEYVARRLYEIEEYLQRRFKTIEGRQEKFQKELEELKRSIGRLEKDNRFSQDLEALKGAVEEFSEFKRIMETPTVLPKEELVEEPDEFGEMAEDLEVMAEEEESR